MFNLCIEFMNFIFMNLNLKYLLLIYKINIRTLFYFWLDSFNESQISTNESTSNYSESKSESKSELTSESLRKIYNYNFPDDSYPKDSPSSNSEDSVKWTEIGKYCCIIGGIVIIGGIIYWNWDAIIAYLSSKKVEPDLPKSESLIDLNSSVSKMSIDTFQAEDNKYFRSPLDSHNSDTPKSLQSSESLYSVKRSGIDTWINSSGSETPQGIIETGSVNSTKLIEELNKIIKTQASELVSQDKIINTLTEGISKSRSELDEMTSNSGQLTPKILFTLDKNNPEVQKLLMENKIDLDFVKFR
uniref:hypothetical protein 28 n=1 Tax=Moniliophthora perniciosa TaxID=153609 RepID=UPI0000242375|nr:hypothetical protein 28 [Moniliophthora perniciosa]AAQ74316.1 hypothetical protein 28 [Moniliophthora perniciosa]